MEYSLERRTIQWDAALAERAVAAAAGEAAVATTSAHAAELTSKLQDRCSRLTDRLEAAEGRLRRQDAERGSAVAAAAAARGEMKQLRRQLAEAEAAVGLATADTRAACMEAFGRQSIPIENL